MVVAVASTAIAQPVAKQSDLGAYAIPFAAESNRIELEVVNSTNSSLKDVAAQLNGGPIWLTFEQTIKPIGVLEVGESATATFTRAGTIGERYPGMIPPVLEGRLGAFYSW